MNAEQASDRLKAVGVDASKAFGPDAVKNRAVFAAFRFLYENHGKSAPKRKGRK